MYIDEIKSMSPEQFVNWAEENLISCSQCGLKHRGCKQELQKRFLAKRKDSNGKNKPWIEIIQGYDVISMSEWICLNLSCENCIFNGVLNCKESVVKSLMSSEKSKFKKGE